MESCFHGQKVMHETIFKKYCSKQNFTNFMKFWANTKYRNKQIFSHKCTLKSNPSTGPNNLNDVCDTITNIGDQNTTYCAHTVLDVFTARICT